MDVSLFDFDLPDERIALRPASPRDSARLLVVHGDGRLEHRRVRDLPEYLEPGDALVVNDTRVIPARLHGLRRRGETVARIELLLHRRLGDDHYAALARPAKKLAVGDALEFGDLCAQVAARGEAGEVEIIFAASGVALDAAIAEQGEMPLPPYIAGKRATDARDSNDYQTIFARHAGSAAAPTAGLHFTPALLKALAAKGVARETITLHVGLGTFLPVSVRDTAEHRMHAERAVLTAAAAAGLNAVHQAGKRVLAVGTTSLRTLESAVGTDGRLQAYEGDTTIFITPGHVFRSADLLLTNFHLPRSTLFMLACAYMGREIMLAAYAAAIREEYRFYSYGDACLLCRPA
ncbi:MAG TPA: tRNA preQ1(34) S-adenosylmethionine ribosyltransferase-isomerase QueA [Rhizomicrobium sp.]|nr:tRNA preQ1(34) S-adenosylmethionine ribosyltransferase-isomerase QueA [Rhizomicrobium sp.]